MNTGNEVSGQLIFTEKEIRAACVKWTEELNEHGIDPDWDKKTLEQQSQQLGDYLIRLMDDLAASGTP